jgi:hypothetical protein
MVGGENFFWGMIDMIIPAAQSAPFSQTPDSERRSLRCLAGRRIPNGAVCAIQPDAGFRTAQSALFSQTPDSERRSLRCLARRRIPNGAVCAVQPDAGFRTAQSALFSQTPDSERRRRICPRSVQAPSFSRSA